MISSAFELERGASNCILVQNGMGGSLFSNDAGVLVLDQLTVANITCAVRTLPQDTKTSLQSQRIAHHPAAIGSCVYFEWRSGNDAVFKGVKKCNRCECICELGLACCLLPG